MLPVPVIAINVGVEDALLVMEIVPLTAPAALGANLTLNCPTWFGKTVIGNENGPVIENPAPDNEIWETLRAIFPGLLMITDCTALPPTVTVPNGMLVGLKTSFAWSATPVPLNATISVVGVALLVIAKVPLIAPAVVGAN